MTSSPNDPLVELRAALAQSAADAPPAGILDEIAAAAFALRPPGRPLHEPERLAATAVFDRAVQSLDGTLVELAVADWRRPALRDLDVQGLVGHLIGVEHDFQKALSIAPGVGLAADHVQATQPHATAQLGRAATHTLELWRQATRRSIGLVEDFPQQTVVSLHGIALPLELLLIVRAFELWTHEEDIRRACESELHPPDTASLQQMVELSVRLLPSLYRDSPIPSAEHAVRLVLIGAAGGTFDVSFDGSEGCDPNTSVVADSVQFCRLVADRLAPEEVALAIDGDRNLAEHILSRVRALALD